MCGTQLREVWREVAGEELEQEEEAIYKDLRASCLFNGLPTWLGRGLRLLGPSLYLLDSRAYYSLASSKVELVSILSVVLIPNIQRRTTGTNFSDFF